MRIYYRVRRERVLAHFTHGANMPTITDAADTYDVPELAALWKCSERHVRNMAEAGAIPGIVRFGRLIRFHRGTVNEWLAEQATRGTRG